MEKKPIKPPEISSRAKEINDALTAAKTAGPDTIVVQPAIFTRVKTPAELDEETRQTREANKYRP